MLSKESLDFCDITVVGRDFLKAFCMEKPVTLETSFFCHHTKLAHKDRFPTCRFILPWGVSRTSMDIGLSEENLLIWFLIDIVPAVLGCLCNQSPI